MVALEHGSETEGQLPPATVDTDGIDLGYTVHLDAFTGPLDLLLHLVRRTEVDIYDIPISLIADQFLETITAWEEMDLDVAGDFIYMAASLLEIKARLVAPLEDEGEDGEIEDDFIDPRSGLIAQLLAYRQVKEDVQQMERLQAARLQWHERRLQESIPDDPADEDGVDLDNADPYALFKAWDHILQTIAGAAPRTVIYDDVPMEERILQVERTMREAREGELQWLLRLAPDRIQRSGVVLAVLEGIRQRFLESTQHEQYGPVYLRYCDEDERRREAPTPPDEPAAEQGEPTRRRRRLPLMTYSIPEGDDQPYQHILPGMEETDDGPQETDEQRFLREVEADTGVSDLLARTEDLEGQMARHVAEALGLDPDAVSASASGDLSDSAGASEHMTENGVDESSEHAADELVHDETADGEEDEAEDGFDDDEFDDDDEDDDEDE